MRLEDDVEKSKNKSPITHITVVKIFENHTTFEKNLSTKLKVH